MKRRTALISLTALGGVSGGLVLGKRWWDGASKESPLAQAIRERLSMLKIPPQTLQAFTEDYEKNKGAFKKKRAPHDVVQQFLLSTDFFPEADETKEIKYAGYHDPYQGPCRNPFRGTPV